ncbi:MAG: PIG-L deacetylase family protein [Anaerolineaceae bacterium]|nr:PIG-L deacetylase family protein [Anaerolineaceae bacterium]
MDQKELNWPEGTKILVILAHPDDPEFFMGATIACWTKAGYQVQYGLLTDGERGVSSAYPDYHVLPSIRHIEQKNAAAKLGVHQIDYFGYPDGYLTPSIEIRKRIASFIRKVQPQIVVGSDPTMLLSRGRYLNHPDHRAAGQIVVDSIFPAVGNPSFFPELMDEGLMPWQVKELWLCLTNEPDVHMHVDEYWDKRYKALCEHKSQIGDPETLLKKLTERRNSLTEPYCEGFRRIIFGG